MHLVKRVTQTELLDRGGHPRRDDPAHPAALDHQCDPAAIAPRPGTRALAAPPQDRLHHLVAA